MRYLTIVLFALTLAISSGAYTIDLNQDKVMETVQVKTVPGGNNSWTTLTITRQKKLVFQEKDLCDGFEGFAFADLDHRFAGQEIIIWRRSDSHESGGRFEKSFYTASLHRWSASSLKYLFYGYYETHQETKTGDFQSPKKLLLKDYPNYLKRWQKAEAFCQALAKKKWPDAAKLIDQSPDAAPLSLAEAKCFSKDCQVFPTGLSWQFYTSPHDTDYICFVIKLPKKIYTIVTNSRGINKMGTGEFD